ncbi:MAG TPA: sialidase family protein [Acidimicrobiales bacterium]|nr:sialidase family protein [Acidimicrobiales bacterium]
MARPVAEVNVEEELPATANRLNHAVAANSPQLAVHPRHPKVMAMATRVDAPDFSCGLQLSADGGRGWAPAIPVPKLPPGAEKCYGPEVAFDRQGVLHFLFVGLAEETNVPMGVFLASSRDAGRTFGTTRQVLGPFSFGVRLMVDRSIGKQGRMHVVWLAASKEPGLGSLPPPPNPLRATRSDDGGRTWSRPVQVSDPERRMVLAPAVALGRDHAVHVLYYDLGDDARDYHGLEGPTWDQPWSLVASTSNDGGRSFGKGVVVDAGVVPPERVMLVFTMPPASIAADGSGRVYVAWHDARNGDWDAFARRSADGGRTWAASTRLNDDALRNGRHQYQPRLAAAPDGRVDAVFYDRRRDATNLRNDVAYSYSLDGGRRFSPNRILTSRSSDTRIGQRYIGPAATGLVDFGARLGLLSQDASAVAAWTDTRNSRQPLQQDVFTTVVRLSGTGATNGSGRSGVAVVGVGVLVAGAWVAVRLRRRCGSGRGATG